MPEFMTIEAFNLGKIFLLDPLVGFWFGFVEILNNITLIHRDYPYYTLFSECMHNT